MRELALTSAEEARSSAVREALVAWGDRDRVRAVLAGEHGADLDAVRALAAKGWFDLPGVGGGDEGQGGQSMTMLALAMEEIGRHPMPGPFQSGFIQSVAVLACLGQAAMAADAARGEPWTIWCGDGADVVARRSPGGWRLSGRVPVVAGGALAARLVVPAVTGDGGDGDDGDGRPAVFVVPSDRPGLSVEAVPTVGGEQAATLGFEAVEVGREAMIGDDAEALRGALDMAVVAQCGELVGTSAAALDVAVAYVTERRQWGRPIATFQVVQHGAADCYLDVEAMRWVMLDAAGHLDSQRPLGLVASMAKVLCVEGSLRVTAWAQQVHGGEGYYADNDPGLFYRRARALAPRLGDVRWHLARVDALRRVAPPSTGASIVQR